MNDRYFFYCYFKYSNVFFLILQNVCCRVKYGSTCCSPLGLSWQTTVIRHPEVHHWIVQRWRDVVRNRTFITSSQINSWWYLQSLSNTWDLSSLVLRRKGSTNYNWWRAKSDKNMKNFGNLLFYPTEIQNRLLTENIWMTQNVLPLCSIQHAIRNNLNITRKKSNLCTPGIQHSIKHVGSWSIYLWCHTWTVNRYTSLMNQRCHPQLSCNDLPQMQTIP